MTGALIIVFREVIEAGLIVGIVLAATRGAAGSRLWVGIGVLAGVLGSGLVALFTGAIAASFGGFGQELFNAAVLATAVVMLIWHNVWMAGHGRAMADGLFAAGREVNQGHKPMAALAIVVGAAVLREGSEVVLFLYGVAINDGGSAAALLAGGVLGLLLGGLVSGLTYFGLLRIPTRLFFVATSWLITLLAAGMAAQSIAFLEQADVVHVLGDPVWDTSAILSDHSVAGRILHTLTGYADHPSQLQLAAYLATIAITFGLSRYAGHATRPQVTKAAE